MSPNVALKSLQLEAWRLPTKEEMLAHVDAIKSLYVDQPASSPLFASVLAVRKHLSTLDVYTYLKSRFGRPNGFQTFLRHDSSDNYIHWDFMLKSVGESIYFSGTSREIHIGVSEILDDNGWRDLILMIKRDFARVAKMKKKVAGSLEKWLVFPNKFVHVASVCADLHSEIIEDIESRFVYEPPCLLSDYDMDSLRTAADKMSRTNARLYRNCLELSLVTPVLIEAFVNMTILMLCKPAIRTNRRQFDSFIRSHIDIRVLDLPYKCRGFTRLIDQESSSFKHFKRLMDRRNDNLHGNVDPEKDKIETVFFDDKVPLFAEGGDHIKNFERALEAQYRPRDVISDYEGAHGFLLQIADCLEDDLRKKFWHIMEDGYPGYDTRRNIVGGIFPPTRVSGYMSGLRYDDQLNVDWSHTAADGI